MPLPDLHLNVKQIYYDQYMAGMKPFEFRKITPYWENRLINKEYGRIFYKAGYPAADDMSRIVTLPYLGWEIQTITHPHFGSDPVDVFAIRLKHAADRLHVEGVCGGCM